MDGAMPTAGAELSEGGAEDMGENTCTVPADLLPNAKQGDTFTVKSVDGGNVVLEHESTDSGEDWGKGLTEAAAPGKEAM